MARTWRDYESVSPPADGCDKRDISDDRGPNVPIVTNFTGVPADVLAGLRSLATAPTPRLLSPEAWPEVVADALRLAQDGWAASALTLGWSALDLFGAIASKDGDPAADGLAVKLSGRKVLAICASFATVADANAGRSYLYRGNTEGARLLWALRRGR